MALITLNGRGNARAPSSVPTALSWIVVFGANLMLGACVNVGPDYHQPSVTLAKDWGTVSTAQQVGNALAANAFWVSFKDPVLLQLLTQAQAQNPTLRSAAAAIAQARAALQVDVGSSEPAVQLQGASTYTQPDPVSRLLHKSGESVTDQVLGQFSWEIDFWGKYRRAKEADRAAIAASQAARASALVSLQATVASTYINFRVMESRIKVANANLREQGESLRLAQARYRAGETSELDWRQARTQYDQTLAQLPVLKGSLQQYQHALSVAIGEPPDYFARTWPMPGDMPVVPISIAVGTPKDLLRRRPDVLEAEMQAASQSARIGQAKASLYPSFNLSGDVGYAGSDHLFTWDNRALSYGAGVTIPFFDRDKIKGQVEVQDQIFRQAMLAYQNQVLKAQQEVQDALSSIVSSREQLASLRESDENAALSATLAQEQYRAGQADYTTVISAEQAHLQASDAVVQSLGSQLQAHIDAFRALGGGWDVVQEAQQDTDQK